MSKRITLWLLAAIALGAAPLLRAQTSPASATPPDFSGVYYPANEGGRGARAGAPPAPQVPPKPLPAPTRTAPLSDGSRGRSPDAPMLTPEYMKRWEKMRDSRIAGSYESDNTAKCLPPGMSCCGRETGRCAWIGGAIDVGVDRQAVSHFATEQHVRRHIERFASKIPQCLLDRAECGRRDEPLASHRCTSLPVRLDLER